MWFSIPVLVFITVVLVASRRTYTFSGILPQQIRRAWIQWRYQSDFSKWPEYEQILNSAISFYRILEARDKSEFLVRTTDFMNRLSFEGREGVEIDDRKRLLLCATLAQITFGFSHFRFFGINRIILYPEVFYSKFLDADVKGVTYGTGFIFLSWQDFEDGHRHVSDRINLGLHEFAHALMLEKPRHFENETYDHFIAMADYLMRLREDTGQDNPIFRDYGLRNYHEFWAVCVEVFFETPLEFREEYPNLYKVVAELLQLDTARLRARYRTADM